MNLITIGLSNECVKKISELSFAKDNLILHFKDVEELKKFTTASKLVVDTVLLEGSISTLFLLKLIEVVGEKTKFLFISNESMLSKNLKTFYFINKPLTPSKLSRSLDTIKKRVEKEYLFVHANGNCQKLYKDEILYVKSIGDYVKVKIGNVYVVLHGTLKDFEKKLTEGYSNNAFFRAHRSYIVNVHKIEKVMKNNLFIVLSNHEEIPLAKTKSNTLLGMIKHKYQPMLFPSVK